MTFTSTKATEMNAGLIDRCRIVMSRLCVRVFERDCHSLIAHSYTPNYKLRLIFRSPGSFWVFR